MSDQLALDGIGPAPTNGAGPRAGRSCPACNEDSDRAGTCRACLARGIDAPALPAVGTVTTPAQVPTSSAATDAEAEHHRRAVAHIKATRPKWGAPRRAKAERARNQARLDQLQGEAYRAAAVARAAAEAQPAASHSTKTRRGDKAAEHAQREYHREERAILEARLAADDPDPTPDDDHHRDDDDLDDDPPLDGVCLDCGRAIARGHNECTMTWPDGRPAFLNTDYHCSLCRSHHRHHADEVLTEPHPAHLGQRDYDLKGWMAHGNGGMGRDRENDGPPADRLAVILHRAMAAKAGPYVADHSRWASKNCGPADCACALCLVMAAAECWEARTTNRDGPDADRLADGFTPYHPPDPYFPAQRAGADLAARIEAARPPEERGQLL